MKIKIPFIVYNVENTRLREFGEFWLKYEYDSWKFPYSQLSFSKGEPF